MLYYSVNVTIQNRNGRKANVWQNEYIYLYDCGQYKHTQKENLSVYTYYILIELKNHPLDKASAYSTGMPKSITVSNSNAVESFTHNHTAHLRVTHSHTHAHAQTHGIASTSVSVASV